MSDEKLSTLSGGGGLSGQLSLLSDNRETCVARKCGEYIHKCWSVVDCFVTPQDDYESCMASIIMVTNCLGQQAKSKHTVLAAVQYKTWAGPVGSLCRTPSPPPPPTRRHTHNVRSVKLITSPEECCFGHSGFKGYSPGVGTCQVAHYVVFYLASVETLQPSVDYYSNY